MAPPAEQIREERVVAIARGDFTLEELREKAEALEAASLRLMEVTLDSPRALERIAALRGHFSGRMRIGAGTVRSAGDVDRALDAGAEFLVAPGLDPESIARARERGALLIPGVLTPSEALEALREGVGLVKLFPCDALGPSYLRALRAPLHGVDFVPTGGVTLANAAAYFDAGAVALGVGSSLLGKGVSLEDLSERARGFRAIASEGRRD